MGSRAACSPSSVPPTASSAREQARSSSTPSDFSEFDLRVFQFLEDERELLAKLESAKADRMADSHLHPGYAKQWDIFYSKKCIENTIPPESLDEEWLAVWSGYFYRDHEQTMAQEKNVLRLAHNLTSNDIEFHKMRHWTVVMEEEKEEKTGTKLLPIPPAVGDKKHSPPESGSNKRPISPGVDDGGGGGAGHPPSKRPRRPIVEVGGRGTHGSGYSSREDYSRKYTHLEPDQWIQFEMRHAWSHINGLQKMDTDSDPQFMHRLKSDFMAEFGPAARNSDHHVTSLEIEEFYACYQGARPPFVRPVGGAYKIKSRSAYCVTDPGPPLGPMQLDSSTPMKTWLQELAEKDHVCVACPADRDGTVYSINELTQHISAFHNITLFLYHTYLLSAIKRGL